jgi:hypothetical protein
MTMETDTVQYRYPGIFGETMSGHPVYPEDQSVALWRDERTRPDSPAQTHTGDTAPRDAIRRDGEIQHLHYPPHWAALRSDLRNPGRSRRARQQLSDRHPYGERTDRVKNVLTSGKATVVTHGRKYDVDQPQVIPMTEATGYFGPKEQKLHGRFAVDTCLSAHRIPT